MKTCIYQSNFKYVIGILFAFCCVSFILIPALDDFQYIASSLLILFSVVFLNPIKSKLALSFHSVFWLSLITLAMLSFFWCEILSFYLKDLMQLSLVILSFISFRLLYQNGYNSIMRLCLDYCIVFMVVFCVSYYTYYGVQDVFSWTGSLDANINYGYSYLLLITIYLCNHKSKPFLIFGYLLLFLMTYLVYVSSILGAQMMLCFIYVFVLSRIFQPYLNLYRIFSFLFISSLILVLFTTYFFNEAFSHMLIATGDVYERIVLLKASMFIFSKNWLVGIGAGHWPIAIHKFYVAESLSNKALHGFLPIVNHSLVFKILVEFGIIGFLFFYLPIVSLLYFLLKKLSDNYYYPFYLFVVIMFLFYSEVYASFQFSGGHFSNVFYLMIFLFAEIDCKLVDVT